MHGEFKSMEEFGKMPSWRGKSFQRFMIANNLEKFISSKSKK